MRNVLSGSKRVLLHTSTISFRNAKFKLTISIIQIIFVAIVGQSAVYLKFVTARCFATDDMRCGR